MTTRHEAFILFDICPIAEGSGLFPSSRRVPTMWSWRKGGVFPVICWMVSGEAESRVF